ALAAPAAPSSTSPHLTLQLSGGNATALADPIELYDFHLGYRRAPGLSGVNRTQFDALGVTMAAGPAGPVLLKTMLQNSSYNTATLTRYDALNRPVAVWVLGTVLVSDAAASAD